MHRLVRAADFERVLRSRSRVSTAHFAVHHIADRPSRAHQAGKEPLSVALPVELSTATAPTPIRPVDDFQPDPALSIWLGTVIPKRHARRAVTRTLLKRQIRAVMAANAHELVGGLWVVRLRSPFDKAVFTSAASDALKDVARDELERLIGSAAQRLEAR